MSNKKTLGISKVVLYAALGLIIVAVYGWSETSFVVTVAGMDRQSNWLFLVPLTFIAAAFSFYKFSYKPGRLDRGVERLGKPVAYSSIVFACLILVVLSAYYIFQLSSWGLSYTPVFQESTHDYKIVYVPRIDRRGTSVSAENSNGASVTIRFGPRERISSLQPGSTIFVRCKGPAHSCRVIEWGEQ